ncbi:hypothetical protein B9479_005733 [Cryptococcus floricola]|uniref:Uncharacterized protein n=1 Tax=Cryptococcus floricola TaxID=2591691 RepID=A0A5D3AQ89_9TREE|nr:hypothetical protein B9479_005733 [Cryptococcus floricola]
MSNIIENVVGGVRELVTLAEGYLSPPDADESASEGSVPSRRPSPAQPLSIPTAPTVSSAAATSSTTTQLSTSKFSLPRHASLIQTFDVPSGWIHLPATYLFDDGGGDVGQRQVRSFGLRNVGGEGRDVEVEVESDLKGQLVFWVGEDEKSIPSSSSSTSSLSTTTGSPSLILHMPPSSTTMIHLAFQPLLSNRSPVHSSPSFSDNDGGFTPRVKPVLDLTESGDSGRLSPVGLDDAASGNGSDGVSVSAGSSQSIAGSLNSQIMPESTKRGEPIHRAFSVHGSISIRAVSALPPPASPSELSHQMIALPFYATVCGSFFTAGAISPTSGLVSGPQQSSGELVLDFGGENVVGKRYHRDVLLVNRSEIELVWGTMVVNAPDKEKVWFELRDLDSENVFGVDHSAGPVPLPALSSRHLRLSLHSKSPVQDFSFSFLLTNPHQPGNTLTCLAQGSILPSPPDESLQILTGPTLDFGKATDKVWSRQVIAVRNTGDRALDVRFGKEEGYEVVFRLAGVAGEDVEEEGLVPIDSSGADGSGLGRVPKPVLGRGTSRDKYSSTRASSRDHPSNASGATISETAYSSSLQPTTEEDPESLASGSVSGHVQGQSETDVIERWRTPHQPPRPVQRSQPSSRSLSRVTSRGSSSQQAVGYDGFGHESEGEEVEPPFFGGSDLPFVVGGSVEDGDGNSAEREYTPTVPKPTPAPTTEEEIIPNQIEEVTMRPGTEYRIAVLHRPRPPSAASFSSDGEKWEEDAGKLRKSSFKVFLDAVPSSVRSSHAHHGSNLAGKSRRTISCSIMSCTSLIRLSSGNVIDFGQVTVGASKTTTIKIENLSELEARVEIAAMSKVLSAEKGVIMIPAKGTVEEKMEFFPRRINEKYEKQIYVRNRLNRANDQLVEIKSRNVDVYNLTLHSHLYRILTPSGSNFLDFSSVVINYPTVRTIHIENLSQAPLVLDLSASQPEDIGLFVREQDSIAKVRPGLMGRYAVEAQDYEQTSADGSGSGGNGGGKGKEGKGGELKERFMEELNEKSVNGKAAESKGKGKKGREKSETRGPKKEEGERPVGVSVGAALKKGSRGKPVQLYGNSVVFKDRSLLQPHEYLDLASGPPIASHRFSPRSKGAQLLESIEWEDKSKLSGQHPKVPKLDFAAGAKATGSVGKDGKKKKANGTAISGGGKEHQHQVAKTAPTTGEHTPTTPTKKPHLGSLALLNKLLPQTSPSLKSPALTAKRVEPLLELPPADTADVGKMSIDQLLAAVEAHDAKKTSMTHTTLEEEEAFVKRTISLRKELQGLVGSGKLVPARTLSVGPGQSRAVVVIMTPNPSIRPHISTRAKRADSRIFIKLVEFDKSLLNAARINAAGSSRPGTPGGDLGMPEGAELPIRDLIIRSSCVRSVLEVQQSSINFGACDKGEVKSKTIVIHNKSDTIGLFRLRTSGSIASGDLKLGLGRYGVISAFGRKQLDNFSFTPSLVGNYQETITVENVLDSWNDQALAVKGIVRKVPAFRVEPVSLDFGVAEKEKEKEKDEDKVKKDKKGKEGKEKKKKKLETQSFVITNISKHERTFLVSVQQLGPSSFARIHLTRDEHDAGTALSKSEEEELEAMMQKLKIARRKGKAEKIVKYETRLLELGVPKDQLGAGMDGEGEEKEGDGAKSPGKKLAELATSVLVPPAKEEKINIPSECITSLNLNLLPNQKTKILVDLIPRTALPPAPAEEGGGGGEEGEGEGEALADVQACITVHDRKNTDETVSVSVMAARTGKPLGSRSIEASGSGSNNKAAPSPATTSQTSSDPVHLALIRHCLKLTLNCEVSPTAFCVGSTLFLPAASRYYGALKAYFEAFPQSVVGEAKGLILADGWSRQIPGNTHAEANALTNLQARFAEISGEGEEDDKSVALSTLSLETASDGEEEKKGKKEEGEGKKGEKMPRMEEVLKDAECVATMEPCSYRTSGGPSCALELVKAGVRAVYLGVEEPPDFVECEGARILQSGGVQV